MRGRGGEERERGREVQRRRGKEGERRPKTEGDSWTM